MTGTASRDDGTASSGGARRGLWIPWLIAGCFAGVVAVNVFMAWCAARSWPGLVSPSAYDQGLGYNRNLEAAARQQALGWRGRLEVRPPAAGGGRPGEARLELRDRDGAPLAGAEVVAGFERPDRADGDFTVPLRPAGAAPGTYAAEIDVPEPGAWKIHVTARHGGDLYVIDARADLR